MKRKAILLITLLLLLLLVNGVQAMGSANYSLDWMVPLTSGGGGAGSLDQLYDQLHHWTICNR